MIFVSSATLIAANGLYLLTIIADTASDLPAGDTVQVGNVVYDIAPGSTGIATDTGKKYMRTPSGTWAEQPEIGDITINLPDVYSESEVDTLLALKADKSTTYTKTEVTGLISPISSSLSTVTDAMIRQVNTGAKNMMQTSSLSGTGAWVNVSINLPAGDYILYMGSLISTDTDATTCQLGIFDSSWTNVIENGRYPQIQRGNDVYIPVKTTAAASYFRLYSADSVAHGAGDTVTATDIMICTADDWAISQKYVPYCPTLADLYALVKSYHP